MENLLEELSLQATQQQETIPNLEEWFLQNHQRLAAMVAKVSKEYPERDLLEPGDLYQAAAEAQILLLADPEQLLQKSSASGADWQAILWRSAEDAVRLCHRKEHRQDRWLCDDPQETLEQLPSEMEPDVIVDQWELETTISTLVEDLPEKLRPVAESYLAGNTTRAALADDLRPCKQCQSKPDPQPEAESCGACFKAVNRTIRKTVEHLQEVSGFCEHPLGDNPEHDLLVMQSLLTRKVSSRRRPAGDPLRNN